MKELVNLVVKLCLNFFLLKLINLGIIIREKIIVLNLFLLNKINSTDTLVKLKYESCF